MRPTPFLMLTAASLTLSSAACLSDADDDPTVVIVSDSRNSEAIAAWLAKPRKSCSLASVLPHRQEFLSSAITRRAGLDRSVILAGADANGFRRFDKAGYELARFAGFGTPVGGESYREEFAGGPAAGIPSVTLRFASGICSLSVDGDEVFAEPLYSSMTVDVASWPGMPRQLPSVEPPEVPTPALAEGFEWLDPSPNLWSHLHPSPSEGAIAGQVAAWLDASDVTLASWVKVERSSEMLLELEGAPWFPPLVLGDGIYTVVSTDERERFESLAAPAWRWYYRDTEDQLSVLEISGQGDELVLRYAGEESRHGTDALDRASRCVTGIAKRILESHRKSDGHFPRITPASICGVHTPDLWKALETDPDVLDIAIFGFTDEALKRYGRRGLGDDSQLYYIVSSTSPLMDIVAGAMVADLPVADIDGAVPAYDDARESLARLRESRLFEDHPELERPLAGAVLVRAIYDRALRIDGFDYSAPPLTIEDAETLAAEAAETEGPYDRSMINRLVDSVSWNR